MNDAHFIRYFRHLWFINMRRTELVFLMCAGLLANISQIFMSNAYKLAPAGQIGPVNYIAIIFAGIWGFMFWREMPDQYSLMGFALILTAIVLCSPLVQKRSAQ